MIRIGHKNIYLNSEGEDGSEVFQPGTEIVLIHKTNWIEYFYELRNFFLDPFASHSGWHRQLPEA